MANIKGYNTRQYEIGGLSDSATDLSTGMAIKITRLPIISSPVTSTDNLFYFSQSTAGGDVDGVVSAENSDKNPISNSTVGRVVMLNAGIIPVLVDADLKKGDAIKAGMNGKWSKAIAKDESFAILLEDISKDKIGLAKPYRHIK
jgi:hypothetical protein